MRLIDADEFKRTIGTETKLRKAICGAIDTQPTAYDAEKVVAELEEAKGRISLYGDDLDIYCNGLDKAINIVKRGGIE